MRHNEGSQVPPYTLCAGVRGDTLAGGEDGRQAGDRERPVRPRRHHAHLLRLPLAQQVILLPSASAQPASHGHSSFLRMQRAWHDAMPGGDGRRVNHLPLPAAGRWACGWAKEKPSLIFWPAVARWLRAWPLPALWLAWGAPTECPCPSSQPSLRWETPASCLSAMLCCVCQQSARLA